MKRKFTFLMAAFTLLAFLVPITGWGQTRESETFTFSELDYANGDEVTTVEGDNVTLTFAQGEGNNPPKYYTTGTGVRMYTGNTLDVALNDQTSDVRITAINFTFSGTNTGSLQNWSGSETSVSFTNTASSQARIQVIAVTFSDGSTPTPTTYTVTYDCNGGTSGCPENVTNIEPGTQIQLADAPSRDNYDFDGWSDGTNIYGENVDYTVNGNVTFTAQWTEQPSGNVQWVLTNLADLTANDVFVIVGNNDSNYAMSNDKGTNSAPTAVAVNVENNAINGAVAANIQWTISGNATDGYTFYPNGSTTTWLYCNTNANSGSNNNMRVGTGNRKVFELGSDNYLKTKDDKTTRYLSIYNNADWRGYINTDLSPEMSFYKKVSGGVVPPSISADNVSIEYNATSGSITYTINNEPDPAGALTATTTSDWLTLGDDFTSPIAFTCTANETTAARTATVTLTYTYGEEQTVTKNVTVSQAAAPEPALNTIQAIFDKAVAVGNTATDVTIAFDSWVVTGVSTNGKNVFVTDGTKGFIIYGTNPGFVVGNVLSGTASCKVQLYKGSAELTNLTATTEGLTVGENGEITVATIALSEIDSINTGVVVSFENLTYHNSTNNYLQDEAGNQIKPFNTLYGTGMTFTEGHVYNVTGVYQQFDTTKEILPRSADDIEDVTPVEPSITVNPATVNAPAAGADGTIAITYENIPELYDFDYYFCDAEGTELPDTDPAYPGDWIDAEIQEENDEYSLYYVIDANDGEARTAYIKVYFEEYFAIVTINQAEYVVDYATLPFNYAGGVLADFSALNGTSYYLSDEGSYAQSNAPYRIKFTTTDDYLQVKTNERPGIVTIGVKVFNTGTDSKITVQGSVYGETFTDIQELTISASSTGTQSLVTTEAFDANYRYVRLLFTKGVNVGVGPISIARYEDPVPAITVTPTTLNVDAEEHDGTLDLTYANLTITDMTDFGIQYYDADGEETEEPDWIEVLVAEQDPSIGEGYVVSYSMLDNEGEARSAYFKVFAAGDEDFVYSNLVTISQAAAPEAPHINNYCLANSLFGGRYIITNGSNKAMGAQNTNNRAAVDVSISAGVVSMRSDAGVHEFAIEEATVGEATGYSIRDVNSGGYLYAASSDKNHLKTQTELDENCIWSITIDQETGVATIVAQGSNTHNVMRYNNSNSGLFSCYGASNNQQDIYLFVKTDVTNETYTREITGYGDGDGGYYLIASPLYESITPSAENGLITDDYDLYYFDQSQAEEWRNYKAEGQAFDLLPGKGYLYASKTNTTLTFTGSPYDFNGQVKLTYDGNATLKGWNLIGNPYPTSATLDMPFYRLNSDGNGLNATTENNEIAVMEGVFVYAYDEQAEEPITTANFGGGDEPGGELAVNISHGTSTGSATIDRAIVRFSEGRQLPKFMLNPNHTKLYFTQGNKDFAVVRSANEGEMPVNFKAETNGNYTISVDAENVNMNYLHLIDNVTGADVDLLATPSYSFEANTNDYATRFRLVFKANANVHENADADADTFAFFNGNEWVVSNIGEATLQVVDVMGRVLSSETINGNAEISIKQEPGVYMLRLINGDNVKTQKVVVR